MTSPTDNDDEIEKLMLQNFSYPEQNDPDLQYDLYKKLEFNTYKLDPRPKIKNYSDLKETSG